MSQPTCSLCPRKGGAFLRARASNFVHAYCAERTPGAQLIEPRWATDALQTEAARKATQQAEDAHKGAEGGASQGASGGKSELPSSANLETPRVGASDGGDRSRASPMDLDEDVVVVGVVDHTDAGGQPQGDASVAGSAAGSDVSSSRGRRPSKGTARGKNASSGGSSAGSAAGGSSARSPVLITTVKTVETKGIPKVSRPDTVVRFLT